MLSNLRNTLILTALLVSSVSSPLAFADQTNENEPVDTAPQSTTTRVDESTKENGRKYEDNKNSVDDSIGEHHLAMLSTLLIGSYTVFYCRDKISAWMATGASLYWFGQEILNWEEYKTGSDRRMEAYENSENNEQIESLEKANEETKAAAKALRKKASSSKTAGQMFMAASLAALVETYYDQGACGEGELPLFGSSIRRKNKPSSLEDLFPGNFSKSEELNFAFQRSAPTNNIHLKESEGLRAQGDRKYGSTIIKRLKIIKMMEVASNILLGSKAHATSKLAGIGVTGALALKVIFEKSLLKWGVEKLKLNTGLGRAALFAVNGGIVLAAANKIEGDADDLEENAKNYKKLANKLKHATRTEGGLNSNRDITKSELDSNLFEQDNNNSSSSNCLEGNTTKVTLDKDCSCKEKGTCRNSNLQSPQFNGFDTPSALQDSINGLNTAVNESSRGNFEAAQTGEDDVSSASGAIRESRKKLEKKVSKDIYGDEEKFEKQRKKLAKAWPSRVRQAVNKMPRERSKQLMSGLDKLTPSPDKPEVSDKIKKKVASSSSSPASIKPPSSKSKKKDPFAGFEFEEEETSQDPNKVATNMKEAKLKKGKEISKRKNGNIFKMISSRYIRSAYPVLFDEEKLE